MESLLTSPPIRTQRCWKTMWLPEVLAKRRLCEFWWIRLAQNQKDHVFASHFQEKNEKKKSGDTLLRFWSPFVLEKENQQSCPQIYSLGMGFTVSLRLWRSFSESVRAGNVGNFSVVSLELMSIWGNVQVDILPGSKALWKSQPGWHNRGRFTKGPCWIPGDFDKMWYPR